MNQCKSTSVHMFCIFNLWICSFIKMCWYAYSLLIIIPINLVQIDSISPLGHIENVAGRRVSISGWDALVRDNVSNSSNQKGFSAWCSTVVIEDGRRLSSMRDLHMQWFRKMEIASTRRDKGCCFWSLVSYLELFSPPCSRGMSINFIPLPLLPGLFNRVHS